MKDHSKRRFPAENTVKKWAIALLAVTVLGVGAFLLLVRIWSKEKFVPPNILLISMCSVRADHMSCYGYQRETTPNFAKLAKESIVFENAITQWPKTAPAFAAIMTGKYSHTTGVMRVTPQRRLGEEHDTLAEILQRHKYDTGAFISTPALHRKGNILQGCETIEELWRLPRKKRYFETTKRAVAWLKKPRKSPFFAWVHYNNAHYPYYAIGAPPGLFIRDKFYNAKNRVRVKSQPLSLNILQNHPYAHQILRPDIGGVHPNAVLKKNPTELDYYIARYDAGIYGVDRMAGNLMREVRKMGLLENTIVVVVDDHGESLGEHNYYFEHGRFPYNDCARVPLMIRPVGGTKSVRVRTPVAVFGLAPTLLEMLGIEVPKDMEARSFLPVAYGKDEGDYVFMESGYQLDFTLSVWDGKWKLIHVPNKIDRSLMKACEYELYNLDEDQGELNNLYAAEPQLVARLRQVLKDWSEPWVKVAYSAAGITGAEVDEKTLQELRSLGYLH